MAQTAYAGCGCSGNFLVIDVNTLAQGSRSLHPTATQLAAWPLGWPLGPPLGPACLTGLPCSRHGQGAGADTEAAALGPEVAHVAAAAVDVAVWAVVQVGGVQRAAAVAAVEAAPVPDLEHGTSKSFGRGSGFKCDRTAILGFPTV